MDPGGVAVMDRHVVAYAETRYGIQVIPPAGYYGRVDHLKPGEVIRFHGRDWTVLDVVAVEDDGSVVVIARTRGGLRRALLFPHPAAAALVVIL